MLCPIDHVVIQENVEYSVFENSAIGKILGKSKKIAPEKYFEENSFTGKEKSNGALKAIFSVKNAALVTFFTLLTLRINSFASWILPWLKWSFADEDPIKSEKFR